jgi:hypothetical protein
VWRPPATQADLEVLNNRARAIMFSLSQTLIEAEAALKHPPTYMPQSSMEEVNPDIYGSGTTKPSTRIHHSARTMDSSSHSPPPLPKATTPRGKPATSQSDVARVPVAKQEWSRRARSGVSTVLGHTLDAVGETTRPGEANEATTHPRRSLPPGGVIGPMSVVADTPHSFQQPSRVNPIGGIIAGTQAPGLIASGRPSASDSSDIRRSGQHVDDPWNVDDGVPPILYSPKEAGPIDPGPAIGLSR